MKKKLRLLYRIAAVVVILLIVAVIAIDIFAERALKVAVEKAAGKTLKVGVSVGAVDLSIVGGRLRIGKLLIDNPPGYQYEKLLELEKAEIKVAVKSLLSDVVEVRRIGLDGVTVVLEQKGISGNNLQDVLNSIGTRPGRESAPSGKKLHIDSLEISNVTVNVKLLPVPGKADTITLKLSPIRMTNLGSDNKLDTAVLMGKILFAIADGVAREGAGILPKELTDTMKSTVEKALALGEAVSKEGEKLIGTGKEIIEGGKDVGQELSEGLKGLLKPKKNNK